MVFSVGYLAGIKITRMKMTDYQDQVISDICDELKKAEKIHPSWPDNLFEGLAIIGEEFGELQQAALQSKYEGAGQNKI